VIFEKIAHGLSKSGDGKTVTFTDHSRDFKESSSSPRKKLRSAVKGFDLPNPLFIRIHCAIAGILHMSGVGKHIAQALALLLPLFLAGLGIGLLVKGPAHWPAAQAAGVRVAPFAGLVVSLLLVPVLLRGVRGLAVLTRRLSGDWCAVPISDPYLRPPGDGRGGYRERLRWLADPATRRDAQWLAVNTLGSWILAAAPAVLIFGAY